MADKTLERAASARFGDRLSSAFNSAKDYLFPPRPPEWPEGDPRSVHTPGAMKPAHLPMVPQFRDPDEAKLWARDQLGGLPVHFGSPDDPRPPEVLKEEAQVRRFRQIAPSLLRAWEGGVRFPTALHVEREDPGPGASFQPGDATMAFYKPGNGSVHLNEWFLRNEPEGAEQTLLHELGHRQDTRTRFGWNRNDAGTRARGIAKKVSGYAERSPGEFVAEAFSRGALGAQIDPETTKLYEELHGPQIPKLLPRRPDVDETLYPAAMRRLAGR